MTPSSPSLLVPPPRGSGVAFVTGAGGFIGRHVVSAFRDAGWTVAGFGPPPRFEDVPQLLAPHCRLEGRVSSEGLRAVAGALGSPQVIVHAAGAGSVGPSLVNPAGDFERNVGSVLETLDFMRTAQSRARLIFLSSAAVYGAGHGGPIREGAMLAPISPYGLHKHIAETLVAGWSGLYGLDACVVRLFSIYGPGLRKQLLWDIANCVKAGASQLRLSGTGQEQRDFLHIDDAVRLLGCIVAAETLPAIVNGGGGRTVTVARVAHLMSAAAGSMTEAVFDGQARQGDPACLVADISEAHQLGFAPLVTLEVGVSAFYAWTRQVAD